MVKLAKNFQAARDIIPAASTTPAAWTGARWSGGIACPSGAPPRKDTRDRGKWSLRSGSFPPAACHWCPRARSRTPGRGAGSGLWKCDALVSFPAGSSWTRGRMTWVFFQPWVVGDAVPKKGERARDRCFGKAEHVRNVSWGQATKRNSVLAGGPRLAF